MSKKRKLTIVCIAADLNSKNLGGAEHHVVNVIKELSKKHNIVLFVGKSVLIKKEFNKNVKVFPVLYPRILNLFGLFYILWGNKQVNKILKNISFDLIWAKQSFPQAQLGAMLAKKYNKPLYITAQNPLLHREELVVKGGVRSVKIVVNIGLIIIDYLISWSYKQADIVACVSKYSAKLATKMGARKVVVIPNGVNVSEFRMKSKRKNRKRIKKNNVIKIVSISSLIPRNGLDTLIDAVSLLPKSIDWELIIAGDGVERDNLKLQIEKNDVKSKVKLLGRVANKKIAKLLNEADLFIRPSLYEGFGVAMLEAMAAGVLVIVTPVGGIIDFVTHRKTGFLVKPNNPKEIVKAIINVNNDKKLRSEVKSNALKLVNKYYQWKGIAGEVEKAFLSIL